MKKNQHLRDILLLFSIPVSIIFLLVAFLYIPRLFANPGYDFIYCEGYSCDDAFSVNPSGEIGASNSLRYRDAELYFYDISRDSTRPIHSDEVSRYKVDASSKSPDGYTLDYSSGGGGFLFWGDYSSSWSLQKGIVTKPITIDSRNSNEFIGWVLK